MSLYLTPLKPLSVCPPKSPLGPKDRSVVAEGGLNFKQQETSNKNNLLQEKKQKRAEKQIYPTG